MTATIVNRDCERFLTLDCSPARIRRVLRPADNRLVGPAPVGCRPRVVRLLSPTHVVARVLSRSPFALTHKLTHMVRVVAISGSRRSGSHTRLTLRHTLAAADEAGAATTLIDLGAVDLPLYDPDTTNRVRVRPSARPSVMLMGSLSDRPSITARTRRRSKISTITARSTITSPRRWGS
ncbi:MAG: putative flavoprotein [Halorubrum sp. J07HR59]|nr:MAG: putative flavoprotein [Halorubrum sp. J07HR59]